MIFAVVAMLTVLGLFFTNANADDTADPANAELNIPVSILDPDLVKPGKWQSTEWTPEPSKEFTSHGSFSGHTYNIVDTEYGWTGDQTSAAIVQEGRLIISLDTDFKGAHFYKR